MKSLLLNITYNQDMDEPHTPDVDPQPYPRHAPRWLKIILIAGLVWGQMVLLVGTVTEPTRENLTVFFSIEASGLYTVLLYYTRQRWMPWFSGKQPRGAILAGILNAAIIETVFLIFEKIFQAEGIAAHPNLLIDLALTMPWYIGMVIIFARVQESHQYSDAAVLLMGGVYELGADGVVGGQVIPILSGMVINLLGSWLFLLIVGIWQFIPVYSSMVLPAAWLLHDQRTSSINRAIRWARPLWWLIPFSIYLIAVLAFVVNTTTS